MLRCLPFYALSLMLACAWSDAGATNSAARYALSPVLASAPDMIVFGAEDALMKTETPNGKPVSAATEKNIRIFLDRFVDANKSPAEMAALVADDAQYYDRGVVGKQAIMREVARYNQYWPYRAFRVTEISYINADPDSDGVFVAYTIDFEVANSMRAITGKAHYAALIEEPDGAPKMKAIRERVVRRAHGDLNADLLSQLMKWLRLSLAMVK